MTAVSPRSRWTHDGQADLMRVEPVQAPTSVYRTYASAMEAALFVALGGRPPQRSVFSMICRGLFFRPDLATIPLKGTCPAT
jgi:hypothetical protein